MFNKIVSLLWSTKVALVLLVLIFVSCVAGVILPDAAGKDLVFHSLWFNLLLVLLILNIVFCIVTRTHVLRLSQLGATIFHLGLVALCAGVVYDQLFFFEGAIHLTEGETLNCAEPANYDWAKKGRFFQAPKLQELGELYLHKLHIDYSADGKKRGVANELAVGEDVQTGRMRIIYVTRPLNYKGFEFYRVENDGYSPLFVLRDRRGMELHGNYAPLQSIKQKDGTFIYRSGSAAAPGSFNFPQDASLPAVFKLQAEYHPDKIKKTAGEVSFQVWGIKPGAPEEASEELFKGKAAFGERVKVGDYFLSMDEVHYWTTINVHYSPGLTLIFGSFWIAFGGLILTLALKTAGMRARKARHERK